MRSEVSTLGVKNNILVLMLISVMVLLTSCGQSEEEKKAEQAWKIMEEVGNVQNEMMELAEKNASWEISDEEYDKKMDELDENLSEMDEAIDNNTEKMSEDDIPSWAKKQGLRKIKWLTFNQWKSEIIKSSSEAWFDWVNLSYTTTDYEKAVEEAEKLASDLNITEADLSPRKSISKVMWNMASMWLTEEQMEEMQWNMAENMKWVMFVNCVLWMWCEWDKYEYAKFISVEWEAEKWSVEISIVNIKQWKTEMEKHRVVNN